LILGDSGWSGLIVVDIGGEQRRVTRGNGFVLAFVFAFIFGVHPHEHA